MLLLVGWSGGAKLSCILHHWGVQLILAYSWTRPAILVSGKGRGGMFFLCLHHFQWEGGGAYSISAVRPVLSVPYVAQIVSVQYLLKGLVYWIEILYTGI